MDTDIQTLQDLFKISYEAYEESRYEADEIVDLFHNRQYTPGQLATLYDRGQPAETFNVIKLFGRLILGYYSTVVNTVKASPTQESDTVIASLMNDVISYTMRRNHMETEGDKIKLDGILQGLMCSYIEVVPTKQKDMFGRTVYRIQISHVPASEILLDPMSRLEDYSDGRYIHRYKWVDEDYLRSTFKGKKAVIDKLEAYENHVNIDQAEFTRTYGVQFEGHFKRFNNYLLVHTVIKGETDSEGNEKWWSIFWVGDEVLLKEEITFREVKSPYRVHKIHTSDRAEYYGIFRDVKESQHAINQALLKIQLMANTQKIFVQTGAVEDIDKFVDAVNRVNGVIPVKSLLGIKIENLSKEILDQYTIIDKALDRIQRVLGVNDSFLGMAFASDSGRKVKLQQNATSLALRYVSVRMEQYYRLLGWDIVNLAKQYYYATQVLGIADERVGQRWVMLNQPQQVWTGKFDGQGQPVMDFLWEEQLDPKTNEPMLDDEGNIIIAPIPVGDTEIAFAEVDLDIDSVIYNDEDEKNQLMMETFLTGNVGQALLTVNPAGFFKASALTVKSMKTKRSLEISDILDNTAQILGGMNNQMPPDPNTRAQMEAEAAAGGGPGSMTLKLPQNTNEEA